MAATAIRRRAHQPCQRGSGSINEKRRIAAIGETSALESVARAASGSANGAAALAPLCQRQHQP